MYETKRSDETILYFYTKPNVLFFKQKKLKKSWILFNLKFQLLFSAKMKHRVFIFGF